MDAGGNIAFRCVDAWDKNTPALSQLYYNLPGEAKMVMQFKGKIVAESHFEVAQYGVAVPLAIV